MRLILRTSIIVLLLPVCSFAQENSVEVGIGIGNVAKRDHRLGKAEAHISLLRDIKFGTLGLDFASGGNFIPGESGITEDNIEIISPKDSRFSSITILYRIPLHKHFFVAPRLGYSTLSAFVHTDDRRKLRQANLSAGFGIGASFGGLRMSFRYQYLGETEDFQGFRGSTGVVSVAEPVSLLLLRVSYNFRL